MVRRAPQGTFQSVLRSGPACRPHERKRHAANGGCVRGRSSFSQRNCFAASDVPHGRKLEWPRQRHSEAINELRRDYARDAVQVPEHVLLEELPLQVPEPESPESWPEALALRPPPLTLTV